MARTKTTARVTKREQKLLEAYRGIQSKHTRNALVLLLQNAAYGNLTAIADRQSLRSVIDRG